MVGPSVASLAVVSLLAVSPAAASLLAVNTSVGVLVVVVFYIASSGLATVSAFGLAFVCQVVVSRMVVRLLAFSLEMVSPLVVNLLAVSLFLACLPTFSLILPAY